MRQPEVLIVVSLFTLALAIGCAPAPEAPVEEPEIEEVEPVPELTDLAGPVARATLTTAAGTEVGTVTFTETLAGVQVSADFHHLEGDGLYGFHVHETGECTPPDFTSAGGHFDPAGVDHACPPTVPRHAGDFGNVTILGGAGLLDQMSELITVSPGETSVVGQAVILHAMEDDCATQPTGDAGGRHACGVIELEGGEAEEGSGY